MGSGVVYEDSYSALLEARFDARSLLPPGTRLEVLNLGAAGLEAPMVIRRLEQLGLRYHPDLIVYGYTLNDIEGKDYRRSTTRAFSHPNYFAGSRLHLVRLLAPRVQWIRGLLGARGSYEFELADNYFENPEAFTRWGAFTRSTGSTRSWPKPVRPGGCT
jgi:hypothetical protein